MLNEVKRLCNNNFDKAGQCDICKGLGEREVSAGSHCMDIECKFCRGTGKKLKPIEPNGKMMGKIHISKKPTL